MAFICDIIADDGLRIKMSCNPLNIEITIGYKNFICSGMVLVLFENGNNKQKTNKGGIS